MIEIEEYAERLGEIHVTFGPIFDYKADGLQDTIDDIEMLVIDIVFIHFVLLCVSKNYKDTVPAIIWMDQHFLV